MSFKLVQTSCCGFLEMQNISSFTAPELVIDAVMAPLRTNTDGWKNKKPFLMFTSAHSQNSLTNSAAYGPNLADYIEKNDLGTVQRNIPLARNWTGNYIKVWLWTPNYEALQKRAIAMIERQREAVARAASVLG